MKPKKQHECVRERGELRDVRVVRPATTAADPLVDRDYYVSAVEREHRQQVEHAR